MCAATPSGPPSHEFRGPTSIFAASGMIGIDVPCGSMDVRAQQTKMSLDAADLKDAMPETGFEFVSLSGS